MKKGKILTICALVLVLIVLVALLCACDPDALRDRIVCEYYYYKDVNGETVRECDYLKVDMKKEGNVLDFGGVTIAPPAGYTFDGFYNDENGEKMFDVNFRQVEGTKIDGTVFLYPIWVPINFTFLFVEKEENGRLYINEDATFNLTVEDFFKENFYTPEPTEYNTEFLYWYANPLTQTSLGDNQQYSTFKMSDAYKHERSYVDENGVTHEGDFIIVRPKFDLIKRQILLKAITDANNVYEKSITVVNNDPLPDLSGYKQKYEGKYIYDFSTSPTEYIPFVGNVTQDITLYAVWESVKSVTLHFYDDYTRSLEVLELTGASFPEQTREHYTFAGWYTNAQYSGAQVSAPSYSHDTSDYYAKWSAKSYPLSFETNGGDKLQDTVYYYAQEMKLPTPTKPQSKFLGWYLDETFSGNPISNMPKDASGAHTLYARWEDSIAISTKQDLLNMALNPDKGYYLTCDISLSGDEWIPIDMFSGTLDGQGHKIYDFSLKFTINDTNPYVKDSYAFIKNNYGTIKNLTIDYFDISYSGRLYYAGALVAKNYGLIDNCTVGASGVNSSAWSSAYSHFNNNSILRMGLVSACNFEGATIKDCKAYTPLNVKFQAEHLWNYGTNHNDMSLYIAQVCGQNIGIVEGCSSKGSISVTGSVYNKNTDYNVVDSNVTGSYAFCVGGIVGRNEKVGVVDKSNASVSLSSQVTYGGNGYGKIKSNFGGVVGNNLGNITRCYSQFTNVSGNFLHNDVTCVGIGGVVGVNQSTGNVTNCYSKAFSSNAIGIVTGGFVGNNFGTVQKCYAIDSVFTVEVVTSSWHIGGFAGYNQTSSATRYCIASSTIYLSSGDGNVLAQQFVGDIATGGAMRGCYYLDNSKILQGDVEISERVDDNAQILEASSAFDRQFLISILWEEEYWDMDGTNPPTLK